MFCWPQNHDRIQKTNGIGNFHIYRVYFHGFNQNLNEQTCTDLDAL